MKLMTAALIIWDKKLLVVHNIKHGLRIEPPGGKKEENETLEQCVTREIWEELQVKIRPYKLFGTYITNSPEGDFKVSMYLAKILSGSSQVPEKERKKISGFEWCNYTALVEYNERKILVSNLSTALPDLRNAILL